MNESVTAMADRLREHAGKAGVQTSGFVQLHVPSEPPAPHGIGWAVKQMRGGRAVRRRGWNGKGMLLFLEPEHTIDGDVHQEHVVMQTVQGTFVPWLCSQSDLLAVDWERA